MSDVTLASFTRCVTGPVQAFASNRGSGVQSRSLFRGDLCVPLEADGQNKTLFWDGTGCLLYRQAHLDRSLGGGAAAAELEPLHDRLVAILKGMGKLFADETRCPVLDPGRGKTKTGYFWILACDDRPWARLTPLAVIYSYAPRRGGKHVGTLLDGFSGILQVDGYDGYNTLTRPDRTGGPVKLAYCRAHLRRKFYEITRRVLRKCSVSWPRLSKPTSNSHLRPRVRHRAALLGRVLRTPP